MFDLHLFAVAVAAVSLASFAGCYAPDAPPDPDPPPNLEEAMVEFGALPHARADHDLAIVPRRFVEACREVNLRVAVPADEAPVSRYTWSIIEAPEDALYELDDDGGEARFFSEIEGHFTIAVVISGADADQVRSFDVQTRDCEVPDGFVLNRENGHAYGLTAPLADAGQAQAEAAGLGGALVSVDDAEELAFIAAAFADGPLWVGPSRGHGARLWNSGGSPALTAAPRGLVEVRMQGGVL